MVRAAFLDRDGVINQKAPEGAYVTRWEQMHFLPGVAEAIGLLNRAGFGVIVVSNQRCIAKGLATMRDTDALHQRMCEALAARGARIDAVYYCPHDKQPPCACRKPAPGMLLTAAHDRGLDLAASWMIGDSAADVAAGQKAGCKTARVVAEGPAAASADAVPDVVASSLLEIVQQILERDRPGADGPPADAASPIAAGPRKARNA